MVDDILMKREEILRRKEILSKLKLPEITRRDLQLGMHSRARRQEIEIYKRKVLSRRNIYKNQLKKINKYLEEKESMEDEEVIINKPKICLFPIPKLKGVRKFGRMNWLK